MITQTVCFFNGQAKAVTAWLGNSSFIQCIQQTLNLWMSVYFGLYRILLMGRISVLSKTVKGTWNSSFLKKIKSFWKDGVMKLPEKSQKVVEQNSKYTERSSWWKWKRCHLFLFKKQKDSRGGAVAKNCSVSARDSGSVPDLGTSHMPRSNSARAHTRQLTEPTCGSGWSLSSTSREARQWEAWASQRTVPRPPHPQQERARKQHRRPSAATDTHPREPLSQSSTLNCL